MLILSWNVAGLSQTLRRIDADYPARANDTTKTSSKNSNSSGGGGGIITSSGGSGRTPKSQSFADFLSRHSASIFCVQEAKIPLKQLSSRSEPYTCSTVPGYESFWSTCVDPNRRGFNGVATYARTGLVRSADPAPLGSTDLDEQGRCVMTDHGSYVLFNVYAPAGGSNPLSYKMKFLNALRRAMKRQRDELGRRVVLVGDLNIAHRAADVHWKYRVVHVDEVLAEVKRASAEGAGAAPVPLPKWKIDLEKHWPAIETALQTKEAIPTTTKNVATGATFEKFRVRVTAEHGRQIFLGKAESSKEDALYYYDFCGSTYFDEDSQTECVAREMNCVSLETLIELMSKIARVEWDSATQKLIASTDADVKHASPTINWMNKIIDEDGMVDTFRHFYPTAKARFTCWHQYTNKRFENEGCRIDYMLVDRPLLPHVQEGSGEALLRCCNHQGDPCTEDAALHAATASGSFLGAGFEGGGIATASQHALDSQFGPAHTGIVYTPPSYSDHIATSLLFDDAVGAPDPPLGLDVADPTTKKAQPHKSQRSIASFFGNTSNGGAKSKQSNSSKSGKSTDESRTEKENPKNSAKRNGQQSIASSFKRAQGMTSASTQPRANKKLKNKNSILSHFSSKR